MFFIHRIITIAQRLLEWLVARTRADVSIKLAHVSVMRVSL